MMTRIWITLVLMTGYYCPLPAVFGQPPTNQYVLAMNAAVNAGNHQEVAANSKAWYEAGLFSQSVLNWNFNALVSLEQNAVLVVQNDAQAYPVWVLQQAASVRTDVLVLAYESLGRADYQSFMADDPRAALKGNDPRAVLNHFLQNYKTVPVYFGVMLDKSLVQQEQHHLYLTGLSLKFSKMPFENLAVLKKHYENDFRLDYLRQDYNPELLLEQEAAMNLNYLPAFLQLYRYYADNGNAEAAADLKKMSINIAKAGDREPAVAAFFNGQIALKAGDVSAKTIDKMMKKVTGNLWAAEVETTNEQYTLFLLDLIKKKDYQAFEVCKSGKTDWRQLLPDSLSAVSDAVLFKFGHPDDGNMPVQQISYEAAVLYCNWLTTSYNAVTEKKKFSKVIFRLPSEEEWMVAARGGRSKETPFPWGGYFVQNVKGCFLLNYNVTGCKGCAALWPNDDGGFFTVPSRSYYPNDFGLYNISGNVSEMVQEMGKAKGGSWMEDSFHAQITSFSPYSSPGPSIGFRVFMEVIEP